MNNILYESQKIIATKSKEKYVIKSIDDVFNLPQIIDMKGKVQENFIVITLNVQNVVMSIEIIGIGTFDSATIYPVDVVRSAVVRGASRIIVAHNHPSGSCRPSKEDIVMTKILNSVSSLLNIKLLDHIIVGEEMISMYREGLIEKNIDISKLQDNVVLKLTKKNAELEKKVERLRKEKISIKDKVEIAKEKSLEINKDKTKSINKSKQKEW